MPASLSNVAIQSFHDTFTNVYQASGKLNNTSQEIMNAVGDAFKWPIQGEAEMVDRGAYQSLVPVGNVNYENKVTTFNNYTLNLPLDVFQQAELQIDVLSQLGTTHALASARRTDQELINALDAATLPAANVIADDSKNMNVAKLRDAAAILDENNCPSEDRFLIMTPSQLQALLGEEEPTNVMYVNTRTLMNGQLDTFMGFKILTLGSRSEGGIPKAGDIRSCFAWHKDALGKVVSLPAHTEVEWSAAHQSWLTISRLRLGASALLEKGIVEIKCDETA